MSDDEATMNADRRGFLKLLALVGMSSAVGGGALALAAEPAPRKSAAAPAAADTTTHAPASEAPPEPSADARALAVIVERRYGKHLTPAQLEQVTRDLDGRVRAGERLRKAELSNADEPDYTFGA